MTNPYYSQRTTLSAYYPYGRTNLSAPQTSSFMAGVNSGNDHPLVTTVVGAVLGYTLARYLTTERR